LTEGGIVHRQKICIVDESPGLGGRLQRCSRFQAFTLIELLVVIAIIALLMSVLVPALERVKHQTRTVVCQSNLHQWGIVFTMFTGDHENKFMSGYEYEGLMTGPSGFSGEGSIDDSPDHSWPLILRSYYKDEGLLCCPCARKPPFNEHGTRERRDSVYSTWGLWVYYNTESIFGSYGINSWVFDRGGESERWRTMQIKRAGQIPILLDCYWVEGYPEHHDEPPIGRTFGFFGDSDNHMKRFCVDRHREYTNAVFMDMSVRSVGIKELWELRWHRDWNHGNSPPPVWPDWMRGFKDYWLP
jgi:prepilin-type N-terminal cleavage/methylation domain-containing protein